MWPTRQRPTGAPRRQCDVFATHSAPLRLDPAVSRLHGKFRCDTRLGVNPLTPLDEGLHLQLNHYYLIPSILTQLVMTSRPGLDSPGGRKRPRMVWTPALHSAFVAVVQELGVETAVPKAIMQVLRRPPS